MRPYEIRTPIIALIALGLLVEQNKILNAGMDNSQLNHFIQITCLIRSSSISNWEIEKSKLVDLTNPLFCSKKDKPYFLKDFTLSIKTFTFSGSVSG
jgi:hypothetical protein